MRSIRNRCLTTALVCIFGWPARAQETFVPSDPIASIDGTPVFLGELNHLLSAKFRVRDLNSVSTLAQQAASASLVRQHLAMKSLRQQGGDALQSILDDRWQAFVEGLQRQGGSLQAYCDRHRTDETSLRAARDWETAWQLYLKNRLTDDNLRRFYQMRLEQYAPSKWNVSHLFIPVESSQPGGETLAKRRMQGIVDQLQPLVDSPSQLAATFAELAKRESDGATAADGGSLGWISASGSLPPPVMRAIRKADAGTLTPPIESPLGLHLVLVHEKSVETVPLRDLEDPSQLRRDAADALFNQLVQRQAASNVTWYIEALRPPAASGR
jgi:hypothetical protein